QFALTHPHQYQFLFMSRKPEMLYTDLDADTMARKGDPARDGYALVRHTVQAAIDRKLLREELHDADLVAQTLWAGVHGMASLHIVMSNDTWITWAPVEARVEQMLDALMHFLAHSRP
ncbi:MAG TPA: TetR-like C-terminal domain-containing protein, partial [Burkholderiales bacterium]|nr:TetR-like C-terminal domain-containing protein [Burkholderiales bacterium]